MSCIYTKLMFQKKLQAMDSGYTLKKDNPKNETNWLSKIFFTWMVGLFYKGRKKGLEVADLYKTLNSDRSDRLADKLDVHWQTELLKSKLNGKQPSLLRAICKLFLLNYMIWGMLQFVYLVALKAFIPYFLAKLIILFRENNGNTTDMFIYSGLLTVLSMLQVFAMHHTNFGLSRTGMRIRIAVSSLIYRKITKLNQQSLGETAAGQVVNLLSNDVIRFDFVVIALHSFWIVPILVGLVSYLLWSEVGIASLAGILSISMFSLPLQGYLGKLTGNLRYKIAKKTDIRVKLMNEIIAGIQVIKMYAWEKPFENIIRSARKTEIDDVTKTSYLRGIFSSCMVFLERTTLYLTLLTYVLLGNTITADKVFSMAQYFNILQLALAFFYPMAITYGSESLVSLKRLQDFLLLEEKEENKIEQLPKPGIILNKVSASWVASTPTLKDITLQIPPGTLCAIVGPVGAGKSSILQLLLGELPSNTGKISMGGEISYSSQSPWLFAATIRNNILFGQPYSKSKYDKVVEVCCLLKDFEQLPYGDKTIVGERGVSLSGGQRARINLARAVYRDADVYLFDDPLSAVDTQVGKHLFDECIYKYLKSKTRILVTHQLQFLKKANLIIALHDGRVEAQGSFDELSKSDLNFTKYLASADEVSPGVIVDMSTDNLDISLDRRVSSISLTNSTLSDTIEGMLHANPVDEETVGDPNASPFRDYFKSAKSLCLVAITMIMFFVAQAVCAGADYFSAYWSQQEELRSKSELPLYKTNLFNDTMRPRSNFSLDDLFDEVAVDGHVYNLLKTNTSLYIYGILIILAIVLTLSRSFLYFTICMEASKNLHSDMFHALLRAKMRFFDTNPSGRILNRFSKDMGAIDEILPRVLLEAMQIMLVMMGIVVNVTIANPYMIIAMIILGAMFNYLRKVFISTAKDIKHLEGITKSPVFSHVSSTLSGITTIRSSKIEDVLTDQFDHHQDVHTSSWYMTIACTVAFGLWMDIICVIFVGCVTFSFTLLKFYEYEVNGALVGLAISQSLILTGMLQNGMRQTAEVVNQLTSVERVSQYTKIESEKPFETPEDKKPILPWPSDGMIEFRKLYLKYVEDEPPVLKNLNITIQPGEKVGIVGRTGAGKSSLISTLFRLAPIEGSILIDGIDTSDVGLTDLRQKISIIPQEPVLFSATMRYNLDPFNEFDDNKLWNVLQEVELKNGISSLDFMVSEGGSNFSSGQRQLICLARAILRNNKILVLDEATANIDQRTDAFIQATIRNKFRNCTVLTIAHRLNTIMDSDKVLVMSFGSAVEFDHPHNLLQIPEGYFYSMVQETGPSMSMQLKDMAAASYHRQRNE